MSTEAQERRQRERGERYQPAQIEPKWQQRWEERSLFRTRQEPGRRKYYYLDMYPYPSGELHMGHMRNYVIGDVLARYHTMLGQDVLHPMGFDAFGQPAEQAAITRGVHPAAWTYDCIRRMREQFDRLGISFDWEREVVTCDPEYYRWDQWFFLRFYERGLAYKGEAPVNWCPTCQVVLADEEISTGRCWRCDSPAERRELDQWFYRITAYADRLLEDIDLLTEWPERVRTMQRNWIGRSEGVEFDLPVEGSDEQIRAFTTRIDTVYGMTYVVLAPEHPLVSTLAKGTPQEQAVRALQERAMAYTQLERMALGERQGAFIGAYAINPVNGERIPIWAADYVLMEYGTGAIMAVPAHDQRDLEFARQYGLPVRVRIRPADRDLDAETMTEAYVEPGIQVDSGPFTGLPSEEAKVKIAEWMEAQGIGERKVHYRMRDWLVSRQRYWGAPIPVVYCDECGIVPVPEQDLPVILPTELPYVGEGGSVLEQTPEFVKAACPRCASPARRETDTLATWSYSSWYYLRYASPHEPNAPFHRDAVDYWLPVDQYVGGIEHAVMHLLYSRFFTKVFHDMGLVSFSEPFARLFTQGMIYKDGAKMSKSRGNVVSPDDMCARYGADTARAFILFIGPPEQDAEWSDTGVEGAFRFLRRVWTLVTGRLPDFDAGWREKLAQTQVSGRAMPLRRKTHQTVREVTERIERFGMNTAISALMELVNEMVPYTWETDAERLALSEAVENLVLLLAPFAPHLAEELWERLGHSNFVSTHPWPTWQEEVARAEQITIVVQVNGRVRDRMQVAPGTPREELERLALASARARPFIEGNQVRQVVVVPDRLVNIVVG